MEEPFIKWLKLGLPIQSSFINLIKALYVPFLFVRQGKVARMAAVPVRMHIPFMKICQWNYFLFITHWLKKKQSNSQKIECK